MQSLRISLAALLLLTLLIPAWAAETQDAGITPGSLLYGLDTAMERLSLLLTRDPGRRAEKALSHARERIAEVQVLIAERDVDLDDVLHAAQLRQQSLTDAEQSIAALEHEDPEQELAEQLKFEEELAAQEQLAAQLQTVARAQTAERAVDQDERAEEQRVVANVLAEFAATTDAMRMRIQVKKEKIRIKLKATQETTDGEADTFESEMEEEIAALSEITDEAAALPDRAASPAKRHQVPKATFREGKSQEGAEARTKSAAQQSSKFGELEEELEDLSGDLEEAAEDERDDEGTQVKSSEQAGAAQGIANS